MTGFSKPVAALIVARDLGCCARCGAHVAHLERGFAWSIHHRRPRGMGGAGADWINEAANGLALCGSGTTGCHGWVEQHRDEAVAQGYLIRRGIQQAEDVAIQHHTLGLVYLTNSGGWVPAEEGPTPESLEGEE